MIGLDAKLRDAVLSLDLQIRKTMHGCQSIAR